MAGGVEEPFLLAHPKTLLQEGHFFHVPMMAGVNSREGILLLASILGNKESALQRIDKNLSVLLPSELLENLSPESRSAIVDEIREFYFRGQHITEDTLTEYLDLLGDVMFVLGFYQTIRIHLSISSAPIYLFQFSFDGRLNVFKNILNPNISGACHADELGYLFKMDMLSSANELPTSAPERLVRARMVKMWTNFVKFGRPMEEPTDILAPVQWKPALPKQMAFLNVGENLEILTDTGMAKDRVAFWNDIYRRYCPGSNF